MCGVKLKDRLPSKELRERLGIDDMALVLQQNRLRWYGHAVLENTYFSFFSDFKKRDFLRFFEMTYHFAQ